MPFVATTNSQISNICNYIPIFRNCVSVFASLRNSSVRFSPIINLLCCSKCYQRSSVKPRQVQSLYDGVQARQMIFPILVVLSHHLGMFHLQLNILKIVLKLCAHEPFDILKHECLRAGFTQRRDGLWEHIAGVVVSTMATTKAEWLARRTTGYQIERTIETSEAYAPNIALYDFQPSLFRGYFCPSILVLAKSVAAPLVMLYASCGSKPAFARPMPKPPAPANNSTDLRFENAAVDLFVISSHSLFFLS